MPAPGPVDPTTLVGKQARTFMIRVRPIGVLPPASSVSLIGGHVDVTKTPAPEIDLCYFMTDTIEVEGIAASTRHWVSAVGTALGRIDVGNAWVLPPTVTVQHHFLPHGTLSPCVDAGRTAAFFTDSQPVGPMITRSSRSATMSALHTGRHRRDLLRALVRRSRCETGGPRHDFSASLPAASRADDHSLDDKPPGAIASGRYRRCNLVDRIRREQR
jgi:hypothetical protein